MEISLSEINNNANQIKFKEIRWTEDGCFEKLLTEIEKEFTILKIATFTTSEAILLTHVQTTRILVVYTNKEQHEN